MNKFIKSYLEQGYKWQEVMSLTLEDIRRMDEVFTEKQTTIDKAFPFLF